MQSSSYSTYWLQNKKCDSFTHPFDKFCLQATAVVTNTFRVSLSKIAPCWNNLIAKKQPQGSH